MSKTLRLRGVIEPPLPIEKAGSSPVEVTTKERVRVGLSRDAAGVVELKGMSPDDVACVEYSNGFRLWTRVDDLYKEQPARQARGAGDPDANVWEIEPRVTPVRSERGAGTIAIEALQFFGVDLKAVAAEKLCAWFERRQLQGGKPGLYQCSLEGPLDLSPASDDMLAGGKPALVFLHGTASSTRGSFGRLWAEANPAGRAVLGEFRSLYGTRVFGLEHATFTESPIDNAIELLERLPVSAELHLVSHSRGGLVGDLLCLGLRKRDKDPLKGDRLETLFQKDRTLGEMLGLGPRDARSAYEHERSRFETLLELLDEKKPRITRFVRVACPARGTTLASGRLDRWLSVLHYLTATTMAGDAVDFLLGIVKERTDPRVLPGLEAMMPGSAIIRLLNHPDLEVSADLSVIAGDIEGESLWGRLKWLVADWFYASDHDLVVNTGSMYGGARRSPGQARFIFDQGKDVNHFSYFANPATIKALLDGLKRPDGSLGGFESIEAAAHEEPAWRGAVARSATQGPRPVAVVLPGTMGSQLEVGSERVWLNYWGLARGGLARLGLDATRVRPLDLLGDFYGDFLVFLSRTHEVVPFPYDWRSSVLTIADDLAQRLEKEVLPKCEEHAQPVRLLAHSMGGLVVRAMIARHPRIWQRLRNLPGSRFVMFGTPNSGSYEAIRWLTGWNPTLGKLALLDLTHDREELIEIIGRFPGLLELLPSADPSRDYSRPGFWEDLRDQISGTWPLPPDEPLQAIRRTWETIRNSPVDKERMAYVAGCAPATVTHFEVVEERVIGGVLGPKRSVLRFYGNGRGDGTVPWDLGVLPGVQTWYVEDTAHDELLSQERAFLAYLDIAQTGDTRRLSQAPPATRGIADVSESFVMPPGLPDSAPDERERGAFILGARRPAQAKRGRQLPRVEVSIRHGNLAYARHPVCVGHYLGDSIVSAEAALDRCLDGALTRRARLGLYPGHLGTHEVFINADRQGKPDGVVVVGLGQVGELSPGALTRGVRGAALEYALTVADWPDDRFGPKGTPRSARLSCLLIGTGFSNMTPRDSMEAILRGIATANEKLVEGGFIEQVVIDGMEFIELFQDVAIEAARALPHVLEESDLADQFEWRSGQLESGPGGRRRVRFQEAPNWWQRLEILRDPRRNELRFIALTDRARAEESLVSGQLRLADDFIRVACAQTANNREVARTLFEMLVPNRLKEMAPRQDDLVLLLDEVSAAYPWELLEDRWAVNGRPLSVAGGMLRQLKTATFRANPLHSVEKTAYVVGNPNLESAGPLFQLADLPGAEREATEVETQLRDAGYTVASQIRTEARDILIGLHRGDYRILHLAGHGVHDFEVQEFEADPKCFSCDQAKPSRTRRVSGMVLGNGIFLTPGDVEQMRTVPELVFINCCHLGSTRSPDPAFQRYTALAANLGTQFIQMGVKAVVAAGWAVDDAAALGFSRAFYRRLLAGDAFGEAVRGARSEIYDRHRESNTWGAYQCYGDPEFRLIETGRRRVRPAPDYRSPVELIADLENLASDFRVSAARNTELKPAQVEALLDRIPRGARSEWMKRSDLNEAIGMAYAELGELDLATERLDAAAEASRHSPAHTTSLRSIEWRANLVVKRALSAWTGRTQPAGRSKKGVKADVGTTACQEVDDVIRQLEGLNGTLGPSVERYCLIGSAHKRRAWMTHGKTEMLRHLRAMARAYEEALKFCDARGRPYPLSNWIAAEGVLQWCREKPSPNLHERLEECHALLDKSSQAVAGDPTFWGDAAEPSLRLAVTIAEQKLDATSRARVAQAFARNLRRGASRKDRNAIWEHVDFLIFMATRLQQKDALRELRELRTELS